MGQLAILHPQPLLKNHPNNMRSSPNIQQTPNFTAGGRRRTQPPKGILNNINTEAVTESKKLVMGQVKILKRGEALKTILKDRKLSTDEATKRNRNRNRKASKVVIGVLPTTENSSPKLEASKDEEDVLCSTNRLGPDPEIVSKQMNKVSDCFAGSAFSDSPPPSSVPLPGFFRKNSDKDDATTNLRRILGLI